MSRPYCTGPCLIYVGLPIQVAQLVPVAYQVTAQAELRPEDRTSYMRAGDSQLEGVGGGVGGSIQSDVNHQPVGGTIDAVVAGHVAQFVRTFVPVFLGTCEVSPEIEITPLWEDVPSDDGGNTPADLLYEGESATVVADLSRWNELVYEIIAARAAPPGRMVRGYDFQGHVGTMMVREGIAAPLWVFFPYVAKAAYRFAFMPPGYRFFATALVGPDRRHPLGTKPNKLRLIWKALRLFESTLMAHAMYDHNMTGLPVPN